MKSLKEFLAPNFFVIAVFILTGACFIAVDLAHSQTGRVSERDARDSSVAEPEIDEATPDSDENQDEHPQVELDDSGSSLVTEKDAVPNFAAFPTIVSKQNGNWSSSDTWVQRRIPDVDDVVKIASGHIVTYDSTSNSALAAVGVEGILTFSTAKNTVLKVGTILVYRNGSLHIGTESSPISSNVKTEIIIANRPLATQGPDPVTSAYDPQQFGTGIVSFGAVVMHGKKQDSTWLKLTQEPKAGHRTLFLESAPAGWSVGDIIVLPDTRQTPIIRVSSSDPNPPVELQLEERTISDISGKTITLSAPLAYDHLGGRDTEGILIGLPHVGNISRNILIRSEDPNGTRGHALFTERSHIDIRYTSFVNMGRTVADPLDNTIMEDGLATKIGTNQIGRYPIHTHHLMGPRNPANEGYQFVLIGNSVVRGAKWGIAIHNSHFGLISNNVVYDIEGSGIITEAANERENVFEKNFVVKMGVPKQGSYNPIYGGVTGPGRPLRFADFGWEGTGLWFSGNDNYVTGNVVANAAYAGVMYNARIVGFAANLPLVPKFRGADIATPSEWKNWALDRSEPAPDIRESRNNEVYASAVGTWVSFSGVVGHLSDYLMWNIKQIGVYSARNTSVSYDNFTIVSDQNISNQNNIGRINVGLQFGNRTYQSGEIRFTNSRVEGFNLGVNLPNSITPFHVNEATSPVTIFDNVDLRNYVNVIEHSGKVADKYTLFNNVSFVQNDGPPNRFLSLVPKALLTDLGPVHTSIEAISQSQSYFFNYNKEQGNNFELFFEEQDPNYVMVLRASPRSPTVPLKNANCPTIGLTNAQCWERHMVAIMGSVAPCTDTTSRLEIEGYTCPIRTSETIQSILNK